MGTLRIRFWAAVLSLASSSTLLMAQAPLSQPGVEVLARGAVHEAFATTAEFPKPGPIVPKVPPQPIEELPPDQRPEGDNVQWIPGYWSWDDERNDFIWISGFWRVAPPGRVWVPGSWRETRGGWQWASGFWQAVQQQAQQIEFLPQPPQPLEVAPQIPAPQPTSYYVPGCWVYRERYVWRPGFWIEHRPGWVWVPAHYRWTPVGYVFVEGYWDRPLHERGILFAPVAFQPAVIVRPQFVYTPTYVVAQPALVSSLFIRRGCSSYFFGDYFEQRYVNIGFSAWCGNSRGSSFALSLGFGRANTYDPNWAYYQLHYRGEPAWVNQVGELYAARFRGDAPRPPRTLIQQNTVVNNITNVTNINNINNTNIINNTTNNINNTAINTINNTRNQALTMVAPLNTAPAYNPGVRLQPIKPEERANELQLIKQTREVGLQRAKIENSLADRQLAVTSNEKPRQVRLDLPPPVVARAQAPAVMSKLPPAPTPAQINELRPAGTSKPELKPSLPGPQPEPKFEPKQRQNFEPKMPQQKHWETPPQPGQSKPIVPAVPPPAGPTKPEATKPTLPVGPPPATKPDVKPTVPALPGPMPGKWETKPSLPTTPVQPPMNKPTGSGGPAAPVGKPAPGAEPKPNVPWPSPTPVTKPSVPMQPSAPASQPPVSKPSLPGNPPPPSKPSIPGSPSGPIPKPSGLPSNPPPPGGKPSLPTSPVRPLPPTPPVSKPSVPSEPASSPPPAKPNLPATKPGPKQNPNEPAMKPSV